MIPNIPQLIALMDLDISFHPLAGGGVWEPLIPADPMRYWLEFVCIFGGNCNIAAKPDDVGNAGYDVSVFAPVSFEFGKQPLLVNQEWSAFDKGIGTIVQVTQIFMRKTELQAVRSEGK